MKRPSSSRLKVSMAGLESKMVPNSFSARVSVASMRLRSVMSISQASEARRPFQVTTEVWQATQIVVPSFRCMRNS